jgi:hypothetical protein
MRAGITHEQRSTWLTWYSRRLPMTDCRLPRLPFSSDFCCRYPCRIFGSLRVRCIFIMCFAYIITRGQISTAMCCMRSRARTGTSALSQLRYSTTGEEFASLRTHQTALFARFSFAITLHVRR